MIKKYHIPDIVVAELVFFLDGKVTREKAKTALAYALNAWSGSSIAPETSTKDRRIELPLPVKND